MRKRTCNLFMLLAFLLLTTLPAYGGGSLSSLTPNEIEFNPALRNTTVLPNESQTITPKTILFIKRALSEGEIKLSTDLLELVKPELLPMGKSLDNLKNEMTAMQQLVHFGSSVNVRGVVEIAPADIVYVYIYLNPWASIHAVDNFLWKITDVDAENKIVVAYVDVLNVSNLSDQISVKMIRTVTPPIINKLNTTEGDAIHRANLVRALPNGSGTGMKIGVISNGVHTRSVAQTTGDLPADGAGLTVLSDTVGGDEGTAMLEIVYDMVPDAHLYFHDCGANVVAFNSAIDELVAAGCNVIVDDIGWITEPFFEQGTVGGHVATVLAAHNIIYVSSAGNAGSQHHQKTYSASATGGFTTELLGYADWHDFYISGSSYNNLYVYMPAGSSIKVVLEWNDTFGTSGNDFDLFIHDASATTDASFLAASYITQNGNDNPLESLQYTTGVTRDVKISIGRYSGNTSRIMEIYVYPSGGASMYTNNRVIQDSIFGHPAVPGVIATGAIAANDSGNDTIESFSSQGPVTLLSGTVQKPDICGIDGVSVTGAGGFPVPFYGTSAAAPHVAAIAAQLWGKSSSFSRDAVKTALLNNAVDLGIAGFDTVFGYGRADAYNAFLALPTTSTTSSSLPTTSSTSSTTTSVQPTTTSSSSSSTTTSLLPCVNDGNCPDGQMCDDGICKTKYALTAYIQGVTGIGYIQALRGSEPLTLYDGASANYPVGSTITLTAFPVAITTSFRLFTGWQGGISGFQNPASIVMNGSKTVTATFLQAHDAGNGTITALSFINPFTQPITVTQNMPHTMPYGMAYIGMSLMGTSGSLSGMTLMGTTGSFTVQLPAPAPPNAKWYKCSEKTSGCIDFSRDVISGGTGDGAVFNVDRTEVTVFMTDNGLYDDNTTSGIIANTSGLGSGGCFTNSDCDDGQYCNGHEICNQGQCVVGTTPCATGYSCNEQTDQCTLITSTTTSVFPSTTTSTSGGGGGGGGAASSTTTSMMEPTTSTSIIVTTTSSSIKLSTSTTSVAQTTTSVQPTTTTSTVKLCPIALIAEGEPEKLSTLRGFRNRILMNTTEGRKHVIQFYKHSPELTYILLMNPSLAAQFRDVLNAILPNVKSLLEDKEITILAKQTDKIIFLLDAIDRESSFALQQDLRKIKIDIQSGVIFNTFNVKVEK